MFRFLVDDVLRLPQREDLRGYKADIIISSPPYNLQKAYPGNKDNHPWDNYLNWCSGWAAVIAGMLEPNGSFFLNIGGAPSGSEIPLRVLRRMTVKHFDLQNSVIWVKSLFVDSASTGFGHFKPVNSDRYLSGCFEYVFHLVHKGKTVTMNKDAIAVPYTDKSNIGRFGKATDARDRGNVWFIPYPTTNAAARHPTAFPVALPEMCLRFHGVRSDLKVADFFCGSGSVGVACVNLGIENFLGVDNSSEYVKAATMRCATQKEKQYGGNRRDSLERKTPPSRLHKPM